MTVLIRADVRAIVAHVSAVIVVVHATAVSHLIVLATAIHVCVGAATGTVAHLIVWAAVHVRVGAATGTIAHLIVRAAIHVVGSATWSAISGLITTSRATGTLRVIVDRALRGSCLVGWRSRRFGGLLFVVSPCNASENKEDR